MGQLLISGLAIGCIYSLVSLGFVITFKSVNILNFAYGELVTIGAYLGTTFVVSARMPIVVGLLLDLVPWLP